MTPRWERVETPPQTEGASFMDAVLKPHRSLSPSAFRVMLGALILVNCGVAAAFAFAGAFPVAAFLGLDILALWLAFRINYRAAQIEERVRVKAGCLHLERRDQRGAQTHWVLNPIWAQVRSDGRGVTIASGRDALRVAAFLSPPEQESFATALRAALWRAKRGY
ncbi:MAG: DUF2244 domain-containing protein [Hyphomonadaceae bacterium]